MGTSQPCSVRTGMLIGEENSGQHGQEVSVLRNGLVSSFPHIMLIETQIHRDIQMPVLERKVRITKSHREKVT